MVASGLLGGDFVGGEIVWWQDDRRPQCYISLSLSIGLVICAFKNFWGSSNDYFERCLKFLTCLSGN